jgi:hypothetical protein
MPKEFIRLTRKEALGLTVLLWGWIEKNPLRNKQDWPGWKAFNGRAYAPYCACCFYVDYRDSVNKYGADDSMCPLYSFWAKFSCGTEDNVCIAENSPFTRWNEARKRRDAKEALKYARMIKAGVAVALKEFNGSAEGIRRVPGP